MTRYQTAEGLIKQDEKHVRDLFRYGTASGAANRHLHAVVIANCAARLLQAREVHTTWGGGELILRAESNLLAALQGWI